MVTVDVLARGTVAFLETMALFATIFVPVIALLALNAWRSQRKHDIATRILVDASRLLSSLRLSIPPLMHQAIVRSGADYAFLEHAVSKHLSCVDTLELDIVIVEDVFNDARLAGFLMLKESLIVFV